MRLPRMTTRWWMFIIVIISVGLGGYVEVARLKRLSDEFARISLRHRLDESRYRGAVPTAESVAYKQKDIERAFKAIAPRDSAFDPVLLRSLGLPARRIARPEEHSDVPFEDSCARREALAVKSATMALEYHLGNAEYHRRRAEYHAALSRKYAAAAKRPWLTVAPDPPVPRPELRAGAVEAEYKRILSSTPGNKKPPIRRSGYAGH